MAVPICLALTWSGACLVAIGEVGALAPVVVLLAGFGTGQAFTSVAGRVLLQRSTSDAMLVRIFSVQEGVTMLGLALGAAVAPLVHRRFGPGGAYVALGVGLLVVALVLAVPLRQLDRRANSAAP